MSLACLRALPIFPGNSPCLMHHSVSEYSEAVVPAISPWLPLQGLLASGQDLVWAEDHLDVLWRICPLARLQWRAKALPRTAKKTNFGATTVSVDAALKYLQVRPNAMLSGGTNLQLYKRLSVGLLIDKWNENMELPALWNVNACMWKYRFTDEQHVTQVVSCNGILALDVCFIPLLLADGLLLQSG